MEPYPRNLHDRFIFKLRFRLYRGVMNQIERSDNPKILATAERANHHA